MNTKLVFRLATILAVLANFVLGFAPASAQPSFVNTPQIVSINPSSGAQVGAKVEVHARVDGSSDFRAMRICFRDHDWCQESGELDFSRTFDTGALNSGTYKIIVEVAAQGDNSWSNPARTETTYELTGGSQPEPTLPPSNPTGPAITRFSFDPSGGTQVGNNVTIHIAVDSNNPGAIRTYVPCGGISHFEHTVPSFDNKWSTSGCGTGDVKVKICARAVGDNDWAYATCKKKTYTLYAPPTSVPDAPTAKLWVDAESIQQGQCTTLHWSTKHASKVNIDGKYVDDSGSKQICPKVTTHYSLKATGPGGEATRSLSVVVNALPATSAPAPTKSSSGVSSSFRNGDLMKIGYDVYVIFNGMRHHVPNPDTLDALGVSQNDVNNRGFSESDLRTIPLGDDIPDVNRYYSGFMAFKNEVFPNTVPIDGNQSAQSSTSSSQDENSQHESAGQSSGEQPKREQESSGDWDVTPDPPPSQGGWTLVEKILTFFSSPVNADYPLQIEARSDFPDSKECVGYVGNVVCRDTLYWLDYDANAYKWLGMAVSPKAKALGVSVHASPKAGDIAVWGPGCQDNYGQANIRYGHVAYVTSVYEDTFDVEESNWGGTREIGTRSGIKVERCISFIRNGCHIQWDVINRNASQQEENAPEQKTGIYPGWLPEFFHPAYDFWTEYWTPK